MKKHDDGYVLAYVTVILLLFCLIATMILTGAMKNMNNQQSAIQQMKDRYAAEGMIQQALSKGPLETSEDLHGTGVSCEETDGGNFVLTAVSGTVQITCTVDSHGKYQSFEIGVPATEPTGEGEVSQ